MAYTDTDRERVADLIRRKAEGGDVVVEAREEPEPVTDLMAALEASLDDIEAARRNRGLERLTKEELAERAEDADIPGRSTMSKTQLIDALRQAS